MSTQELNDAIDPELPCGLRPDAPKRAEWESIEDFDKRWDEWRNRVRRLVPEVQP